MKKKYSNSVGWSDKISFKTPPTGGSNELKFLAFGDMGKAPLDPSVEHYIQVISLIYDKNKNKIFIRHLLIILFM